MVRVPGATRSLLLHPNQSLCALCVFHVSDFDKRPGLFFFFQGSWRNLWTCCGKPACFVLQSAQVDVFFPGTLIQSVRHRFLACMSLFGHITSMSGSCIFFQGSCCVLCCSCLSTGARILEAPQVFFYHTRSLPHSVHAVKIYVTPTFRPVVVKPGLVCLLKGPCLNL